MGIGFDGFDAFSQIKRGNCKCDGIKIRLAPMCSMFLFQLAMWPSRKKRTVTKLVSITVCQNCESITNNAFMHKTLIITRKTQHQQWSMIHFLSCYDCGYSIMHTRNASIQLTTHCQCAKMWEQKETNPESNKQFVNNISLNLKQRMNGVFVSISYPKKKNAQMCAAEIGAIRRPVSLCLVLNHVFTEIWQMFPLFNIYFTALSVPLTEIYIAFKGTKKKLSTT